MGEKELQAFRLRNALHRQFGGQYDIDAVRKFVEWVVEESLTPKQRKYYCLHYGEGISMAAIGRMHGVRTSTVSRTLARATTRIKKALHIVEPLLPNKGKPRRKT